MAKIRVGKSFRLLIGAEVIKIEPPGTGELLRKRGPAKHGTNYCFLMLNTGKKSVSLNLKEPRGRDLLFRMLADSDVILENYAPGALERLGLGYDDLARRFPRMRAQLPRPSGCDRETGGGREHVGKRPKTDEAIVFRAARPSSAKRLIAALVAPVVQADIYDMPWAELPESVHQRRTLDLAEAVVDVAANRGLLTALESGWIERAAQSGSLDCQA